MAQHFKRAGNLTSMESVKVSPSSSRSKSPSKEALARFNSKLSLSGGKKAQSHVSWKRLRKRSPWLKQLYRHQKRGVEAIVSTDGFAALFAQRTGKTWVTGAVLCVEENQSLDVLLVGPLTNLESTWGKFLAEKLPWYTVHRSLEEYDAHQKAFVKAWGHRSHCVLLLNPEQVTPIRDKLKRRKWDRFIWDEAQRLKNRSSQSSRDAAYIGKSAKKRLALTGTPMDLDPKDLWAIMRFVQPNALGDVWKDFEDEFLVKPTIDLTKKMGQIQRQRMMLAYQIAKRKAPMREDKLKKYAKLLRPHAMRISKEDAGIIPANVHIVEIDLDPQELERYKKLERNLIIKHGGKVIKTPLKITQIGKLQQLTGGHIKDEDGDVHEVGTSKRRALRKLILKKVKDEPFVVFCKYVWEVHMIARMLERMELGKGARLWGKVKDIKKDKRRTNMLLSFQRGELTWMVCQQRTGGVGVDLYTARKAFVYSMGHSFIDYDQMLSRLDFLEQMSSADFFLLVVRRSIDTDIVVSVKRKKSITEAFYDRLT
jgi:SNF2 family DNA or RNA helicase